MPVCPPSDTARTPESIAVLTTGTPAAIAYVWEVIKDDEYLAEEKLALLVAADAHLGLSLLEKIESSALTFEDLSEELREMLTKRDTARTGRDFATADRLRTELENRGYHVEDSSSGTVLRNRD